MCVSTPSVNSADIFAALLHCAILRLRPFCEEFAGSPCVYIGSLWVLSGVLQVPPTVQKHAFEVNRKL